VKALVVNEIGDQPRLSQSAEPEAGRGETAVRVLAVALNPVDVSVATGRFFGGHPPVPYIPGVEVVGEVVSSDAVPVGSVIFACLRGLGVSRNGTCAETAVVRDDQLVPVPAETDALTAALAGTAALAAWIPLSWRAPVRADDTVVVLGATGAVGAVAVQAAKALGARRVVAVGRDAGRLRRAAELGADAIASINDPRGLVAALTEACPEGATLIFDPLWGDPVVAALTAAAQGARLLQLGQSAHPDATIPSGLIRGKDIEIYGYTNLTAPHGVLSSAYGQLVGHIKQGTIRVDAETFPIEESARAFGRLQTISGSKVVILPASTDARGVP
jgi:NADPH2:quinone reductase